MNRKELALWLTAKALSLATAELGEISENKDERITAGYVRLASAVVSR